MDLSRTQNDILNLLKTRGPQSVRLLASRLGITSMGVRQHLNGLHEDGLASPTQGTKRQTRGRPIHLWHLTQTGHGRFADTHRELATDLIISAREALGEEGLNQLIARRSDKTLHRYRAEMEACTNLQSRLQVLARLRSDDGYMAEIRVLPNGALLLIENHCPICQAAEQCNKLCSTELDMFRQLLSDLAGVERVDYLLAGARRCAYRVVPHN